MAKYTKNFALMVSEKNAYWGKDGLARFVESLLGPADRDNLDGDTHANQSTEILIA